MSRIQTAPAWPQEFALGLPRIAVSPRVASWLLIVAVNLSTFNLSPEAEGEKFSASIQLVIRLAMCAVCGLYGLQRLPTVAPQLLRFPGAWGTLFGVWAVLTVPLSLSPLYALVSVFALWCIILFAPAVLAQLGRKRALEVLLQGLLLFVAVSWGLYFVGGELGRSAFVMPSGDTIYRFGNDAQQLGLQIAWALGFLLTLTFWGGRPWRKFALPFLFLLATLPLTQSRTGMIGSAAAMGIVVWEYLDGRQRILAVAGGLLLLAGGLFVLATGVLSIDPERLAQSVSRSGEAEEIGNFTGRDVIWAEAWARVCDWPIMGCGYGCSRFALDSEALNPPPHHAHNLLLNITLCLGFVGAGLFVAMLLHLLVDELRHPTVVPAIALVLVMLTGISEPLLFGPMPRSHTVIFLMALFWRQLDCGRSTEPALLARES
jgi:O-antigen ligase